jgi:uncharacterized membrane protein
MQSLLTYAISLLGIIAAFFATYSLLAAAVYAAARKTLVASAMAARAVVWAFVFLIVCYPSIFSGPTKWLLIVGIVFGPIAFIVRAIAHRHDESDERGMIQQWEDSEGLDDGANKSDLPTKKTADDEK